MASALILSTWEGTTNATGKQSNQCLPEYELTAGLCGVLIVNGH